MTYAKICLTGMDHPMAKEEERLMSLGEVAEYLRVTPRTVLRYVSRHGLPHLRGPGGETYFD